MLSRLIGERGRIIGITIIVTTLYLLLQQLWLGLTDLPLATSLAERPSDAELEKEAKKIAAASLDALPTTPANARHDILQLGFHLGYLSQLVGSYAMSTAAVQLQVSQNTEPRRREVIRLSQVLGLGIVNPLPSRTLDDFTRLTDRVEADEMGVAGRITRKFSPQHLHLFMFGVHLGTEAARIQTSAGAISLPPRAQIRRHATLAGIPKPLWEPFSVPPDSREKPADVVARYRNGWAALDGSLSSPPGN